MTGYWSFWDRTDGWFPVQPVGPAGLVRFLEPFGKTRDGPTEIKGRKQIAAGPGEEVSDSLHESQELFTKKKKNLRNSNYEAALSYNACLDYNWSDSYGFPKDPLVLGPLV